MISACLSLKTQTLVVGEAIAAIITALFDLGTRLSLIIIILSFSQSEAAGSQKQDSPSRSMTRPVLRPMANTQDQPQKLGRHFERLPWTMSGLIELENRPGL